VYKWMDQRWYKMEKEHHKRIWRLVETGDVEHDGVTKMENYPILTVVCLFNHDHGSLSKVTKDVLDSRRDLAR